MDSDKLQTISPEGTALVQLFSKRLHSDLCLSCSLLWSTFLCYYLLTYEAFVGTLLPVTFSRVFLRSSLRSLGSRSISWASRCQVIGSVRFLSAWHYARFADSLFSAYIRLHPCSLNWSELHISDWAIWIVMFERCRIWKRFTLRISFPYQDSRNISISDSDTDNISIIWWPL